MARRERTVFDGLGPDENLSPRVAIICPELIEAYEEVLAKLDDEIADKMKTRAAWIRRIGEARQALKAMSGNQ